VRGTVFSIAGGGLRTAARVVGGGPNLHQAGCREESKELT
jgi:hypothetical protein